MGKEGAAVFGKTSALAGTGGAHLVLAVHTATHVGAQHFALEALTVLLQTAGFLAVAPSSMFGLGNTDFGLKGLRVPIQSGIDGFSPYPLSLHRVEAVGTVAASAVLVGSEAVTIQLQTPGLHAVAADWVGARHHCRLFGLSHSLGRSGRRRRGRRRCVYGFLRSECDLHRDNTGFEGES